MHTIQELSEGHWEQWQPLWKGYLEFYRAELPAETTHSSFARLVGEDDSMFGDAPAILQCAPDRPR